MTAANVPPEWLADAVLEVFDHFGAAGYETLKLEEHWRRGGVVYRDNLVRLVVDVPDTVASRAWMKEFKRRWKTRLEQLELMPPWYPDFRTQSSKRPQTEGPTPDLSPPVILPSFPFERLQLLA